MVGRYREAQEGLEALRRERKEALREVVEARKELDNQRELSAARIAEIHEQLDARLRERQERRAEMLRRESERAHVSNSKRAAAAAARSAASRSSRRENAVHAMDVKTSKLEAIRGHTLASRAFLSERYDHANPDTAWSHVIGNEGRETERCDAGSVRTASERSSARPRPEQNARHRRRGSMPMPLSAGRVGSLGGGAMFFAPGGWVGNGHAVRAETSSADVSASPQPVSDTSASTPPRTPPTASSGLPPTPPPVASTLVTPKPYRGSAAAPASDGNDVGGFHGLSPTAVGSAPARHVARTPQWDDRTVPLATTVSAPPPAVSREAKAAARAAALRAAAAARWQAVNGVASESEPGRRGRRRTPSPGPRYGTFESRIPRGPSRSPRERGEEERGAPSLSTGRLRAGGGEQEQKRGRATSPRRLGERTARGESASPSLGVPWREEVAEAEAAAAVAVAKAEAAVAAAEAVAAAAAAAEEEARAGKEQFTPSPDPVRRLQQQRASSDKQNTAAAASPAMRSPGEEQSPTSVADTYSEFFAENGCGVSIESDGSPNGVSGGINPTVSHLSGARGRTWSAKTTSPPDSTDGRVVALRLSEELLQQLSSEVQKLDELLLDKASEVGDWLNQAERAGAEGIRDSNSENGLVDETATRVEAVVMAENGSDTQVAVAEATEEIGQRHETSTRAFTREDLDVLSAFSQQHNIDIPWEAIAAGAGAAAAAVDGDPEVNAVAEDEATDSGEMKPAQLRIESVSSGELSFLTPVKADRKDAETVFAANLNEAETMTSDGINPTPSTPSVNGTPSASVVTSPSRGSHPRYRSIEREVMYEMSLGEMRSGAEAMEAVMAAEAAEDVRDEEGIAAAAEAEVKVARDGDTGSEGNAWEAADEASATAEKARLAAQKARLDAEAAVATAEMAEEDFRVKSEAAAAARIEEEAASAWASAARLAANEAEEEARVKAEEQVAAAAVAKSLAEAAAAEAARLAERERARATEAEAEAVRLKAEFTVAAAAADVAAQVGVAEMVSTYVEDTMTAAVDEAVEAMALATGTVLHAGEDSPTPTATQIDTPPSTALPLTPPSPRSGIDSVSSRSTSGRSFVSSPGSGASEANTPNTTSTLKSRLSGTIDSWRQQRRAIEDEENAPLHEVARELEREGTWTPLSRASQASMDAVGESGDSGRSMGGGQVSRRPYESKLQRRLVELLEAEEARSKKAMSSSALAGTPASDDGLSALGTFAEDASPYRVAVHGVEGAEEVSSMPPPAAIAHWKEEVVLELRGPVEAGAHAVRPAVAPSTAPGAWRRARGQRQRNLGKLPFKMVGGLVGGLKNFARGVAKGLLGH